MTRASSAHWQIISTMKVSGAILEEGGVFGDNGYARSNGGRFVDIYDGDIESIPEEYRISSPVVMERAAAEKKNEWHER